MTKRKIFLAFFAALISIGIMIIPFTASAAENSATQDGLVEAIVSDKDNYSGDEDIDLIFKVTNTNDYVVENVSLEAIIPDGLILKGETDTKTNAVSLGAGESLELTLTAVKRSEQVTTASESETRVESTTNYQSQSNETNNSNISVNSSDSSGDSNNSANSVGGSDTSVRNNADNSTIATGQNMIFAVICLICLCALFVIIFFMKTKKKTTRSLSIILSVCIAVSAVTTVALPAAAAGDSKSCEVEKIITVDNDSYALKAKVTYDKNNSETEDKNIVTRGEWVDMLVKEFSMTSGAYEISDIPYKDIENSEYSNAIAAAYFNAILPTSIEEFKPDEYATRDFAVLTLNNCLCYVKNDDLDCDDFESIDNKDDASALVERGYFELTYNKFMPDKAVTVSEMNNAKILIRESLQKLQINENHKNVVDLQDDVVVLDSGAIKNVGEDKVVMVNNEQTALLKPGDVFFASNPENSELSVAYKVENVDTSENEIKLSVSKPELCEMYKNIDIQGVVKANSDNQKSKSVYDNSVGANFGDTVSINADKLKFDKTYTIDAGDGDKIEVKLNGGLENPQLEYKVHATYNPFVPIIHINDDFEFYAALKNKLKFYGEASVTFGQGKSGKIQIAKIPVPICPGISVDISVDLVVNVNGKISIEYSLQNQVGVLLDKNGLELKKDFSEPEFAPKAEMDVTLGLSPSVELNAIGFIVGANAEIGAKASGKAALLKDDKIHTDLSAHMYFNTGVYADGLAKNFLELFKLGTEKTFEIINKDNSPIRGNLHLEGMEIVNKCTYRYAEGKVINNNNIPIDDVTVEVYIHNTDKSPVCTSKTSDFGEFGILIPTGEAGYPDNLIFKFIKEGYQTLEQSLTVKIGEDTEFGTIEMKKSSGEDETIKTINYKDKLTLTGTLKSEDYVINGNNNGTVDILDIDTPFKCYLYYDELGYEGKTEFYIDSVQINNLSDAEKYYGKNITVTGLVTFAHTGHHRRSIVLEDCSIVNENISYKRDFIDAILESEKDLWGVSRTDEALKFLDLNFDGNLELIIRHPGGTMRNHSFSAYYLKDSRVTPVNVSQNNDWVIINGVPYGNLKGYYDRINDTYKIIEQVVWSENSSAMNYWRGNCELNFDGENLATDYYSSMERHYNYNTQNESYKYYDGANKYADSTGANEISEAKYDEINNEKLNNLVDINMKCEEIFYWDWKDYSDTEKREALEKVYDSFTYDKY